MAPSRFLLPALVGVLLSPVGLAADPLGPGASFTNAFVFGDLTISNNDSDGPLAAGGDARFLGAFQANSAELGTSFGSPMMTNVGLLVRGGLVAPPNNGDLKVKGNAYVAGTISGGSIQYQSGSLLTGAAVDVGLFDRQRSFSLAQTAAIRGMVSGGSVTGSGNAFTFDLAAAPTILLDGQPVKRATIAASLINANPLATLGFQNVTAGTTVLLDVTGSGNLDWSWSVNGIGADRLLWNARDLARINVNDRDFTGSLLAPTAAVTLNNGNFDGNLVADSLVVNNGKELHWGAGRTFAGPAPVPEPATFLALSLGGAALLRRRR